MSYTKSKSFRSNILKWLHNLWMCFFLRIGEPPRIFTSEKLCLCNASIHTHLSYCPAANEPN